MLRHHMVHVRDTNQHRTITAALSSAAIALVLVVLPVSAAGQEFSTAAWDEVVTDARCEQDVRGLEVWLEAVAYGAPERTNHQRSGKTRATSGGTHSVLAAHLAADCPEVGQVLAALEDLPADGQARALAEWMPRAVAACGCAVDLDALKVVSYAAAVAPREAPRTTAVAARDGRDDDDAEPVTPNGKTLAIR